MSQRSTEPEVKARQPVYQAGKAAYDAYYLSVLKQSDYMPFEENAANVKDAWIEAAQAARRATSLSIRVDVSGMKVAVGAALETCINILEAEHETGLRMIRNHMVRSKSFRLKMIGLLYAVRVLREALKKWKEEHGD